MEHKQLKIDPEFRDKIPPLTEDEFSKLEENIVTDGEVRDPIVVWNGTIIDGHNRWKIIQKHPDIPYRVKEMPFANKWEAIVWMCHNQLGRRNVTDEQKTVLIGEAYKAQKIAQGSTQQRDSDGRFHRNGQSDHFRSQKTTAQRIAEKFNVGEKTIRRAEHFVDGLNSAEEVSPGFKTAILSGDVKAPKSTIAEIRKMEPERKKEVVQAIIRGDGIPKKYEPIKNATPTEPRPAYNLDDFREELMAVVKSLDRSFRTTLVLAHPEMLKTEGGMEIAETVMDEARKTIDELRNMIKEEQNSAESI